MRTIDNETAVISYPYNHFIEKLGLKPLMQGDGGGKTLDSAQGMASAIQAGETSEVMEGGRNVALTSLGGALRRRGVTPDLIRSCLLAHNLLACKPPLPAAEVERIAESVSRYDPQPPAEIASTLTDSGNADRLERDWQQQARYVPEWGKWILWDGSRWIMDTSGQIMELAKETARRILEEGVGIADQETRKAVTNHSVRSLDLRRLKAMVELAKTLPNMITLSNKLNADRMLLCVRNGVINLRTGELRAATPDDLITSQVPVEFDPNAKCPTFEAFLSKIMGHNKNLVNYIQRVIGYCLTGETTEQCLFFLYGKGSNGKSTLLNVIKALLGDDYCKQTPSETLMASRNSKSANNDVARLQGVRVVLSNEVEEGSRLSESLIKQLTGGDPISARYLYAEFFEFVPEFKLMIAGNHQPVIRGDDTGIWRRLQMIPFTTTIMPEERDPELPRKLQAELPGILNFAIQGCLVWQANGLQTPTEVTDAVNEYRTDMDLLGQWINERCEVADNKKVLASFAYQDYKNWAMQNGFQLMSSNTFGRRLGERHAKMHTRDGNVYQGLALKVV